MLIPDGSESDSDFESDIVDLTIKDHDAIMDFANEDWLYKIKPYLRPMETMTDDEFEELSNIYDCIVIKNNRLVVGSDDWYPPTFEESIEIIDWLNKKGFDYRGLIPMGIALEAPQNMYK